MPKSPPPQPRLARSTRGDVPIEYAVFVAALALAILGATQLAGERIGALGDRIAGAFTPARLDPTPTGSIGAKSRLEVKPGETRPKDDGEVRRPPRRAVDVDVDEAPLRRGF